MLANSCITAFILPAMLKPCVADLILPQVLHLNKIVLPNCDRDFMPLKTISLSYDIKIFSAYLKGLSKYRRMAFFFLKYLFSFKRY